MSVHMGIVSVMAVYLPMVHVCTGQSRGTHTQCLSRLCSIHTLPLYRLCGTHTLPL